MTIQYNENYKGTIPFSDTDKQFACTVNAEQTWTIPGTNIDQYQALFSFTEASNVFVCNNATPVIPANGGNGTQPYNEFRPKKRYVKGGDVLHFITPDALAYFGVSLRKLQG